MRALLLLLAVVALVLIALVLARAGRLHRSATGGGRGVGVLFHGSPRELDVVRPSPSSLVGNEEVVYGTPSRWLALVFSAQARSKDLDFGYVSQKPYIAEMHPGAFELLNKPGYVHVVSADGFRADPRLGMQGAEFVKRGKATVTEVEKVPNVLEDLKRFPEIRMVSAADRPGFFREAGIPLSP